MCLFDRRTGRRKIKTGGADILRRRFKCRGERSAVYSRKADFALFSHKNEEKPYAGKGTADRVGSKARPSGLLAPGRSGGMEVHRAHCCSAVLDVLRETVLRRASPFPAAVLPYAWQSCAALFHRRRFAGQREAAPGIGRVHQVGNACEQHDDALHTIRADGVHSAFPMLFFIHQICR